MRTCLLSLNVYGSSNNIEISKCESVATRALKVYMVYNIIYISTCIYENESMECFCVCMFLCLCIVDIICVYMYGGLGCAVSYYLVLVCMCVAVRYGVS